MNPIIQLLRDNKKLPGEIRAETSGDSPRVYLKGVISADWGVSAADLRAAFETVGGRDVSLRINSPGGDVFEGREMQAVITNYPGKVTAVVEGITASAGTIVAMAANETHMLRGSRYMIHNGQSIGLGDRHDFKALYELLATFDAELAAEYAKYSGQKAEDISGWMDAETWYTAEEALDKGFVQKVIDNTKADHVTAQLKAWNLSAYRNAPDLSAIADPAPDFAAVRAANERRLRLLSID